MGSKDRFDAQQTRMSVISNNLANVNTTGFGVIEQLLKIFYTRLFVALEDRQRLTLKHQQDLCWNRNPNLSTEKIHAQGNLIQTQNARIWRLMVKVFSKYYNQTAP